jgi:hypothetical protein
MSEGHQRAYWIDIAKLIAIIAVLIDHTYNILYTNPKIAYCSYFSVSLFILVMGVTSYWSYSNYTGVTFNKLFKGCWKIIRPYLVATMIIGIIADNQFNLLFFLTRLTHFNASGPFYYVLLYIQLLFAVPMLYYFLQQVSQSKYEPILELLLLFIIVVFSSLTTIYTNILGVYGGGGKLFGGTYLILLYIGMLFAKHLNRIRLQRITLVVILFLFLVIATFAWASFIAENQFQLDSHISKFFGFGLNPPSISLLIYSILLFLTIYFFGELICLLPTNRRVIESCTMLGKHTLYIFLYHRLFLDYILPVIGYWIGFVFINPWIIRVFYFIGMIGGPLLIEFVFENIHKYVVKAYIH